MINWRMVLLTALAGVVGAIIAASWASTREDRYEVSAVMAVGPSPTLTEDADVIDVVASLERGGITATAAGIATSSSVRRAAVAELGLEPGEAGDYEVDAVPVLTSSLVDITVSGPDPDLTAELANAVAAQLQAQFSAIYEVYAIELVTPATPPTNSTRPTVWLISLLGAVVAAAGTAAVLWAAFGGRWRAASGQASEM